MFGFTRSVLGLTFYRTRGERGANHYVTDVVQSICNIGKNKTTSRPTAKLNFWDINGDHVLTIRYNETKIVFV